MFYFSDAWLLATLILSTEWVSLQQVIAGGDLINHAIFTADEINSALSVLTVMGYVEFNKEKRLRATEKAYNLCDETYLKAGLFSKTDRILDRLKKAPCVERPKAMMFYSDKEILIL